MLNIINVHKGGICSSDMRSNLNVSVTLGNIFFIQWLWNDEIFYSFIQWELLSVTICQPLRLAMRVEIISKGDSPAVQILLFFWKDLLLSLFLGFWSLYSFEYHQEWQSIVSPLKTIFLVRVYGVKTRYINRHLLFLIKFSEMHNVQLVIIIPSFNIIV